MITSRPSTASRWPGAEGSPYVDWWTQSEYRSGIREIAAPELAGVFRFAEFYALPPATVAGAMRFRPGTPPVGARGTRRTMPMWPSSLPPETSDDLTGQPQDNPQDNRPSLIKVPPSEFGDPLPAHAGLPPAVAVVIDTDINPLHERFLDAAGGPRVVAHWLTESAWRSDRRVPFGREVRTAELHAALALGTEDEGLRALDVETFTRAYGPRGAAHPLAHGTHVMTLAAGTDPQDRSPLAAALREVPILAVSLPSNRLLSASGVFLDVFVDQALEWVAGRLAEMFPQGVPPVVVNLSYGLAAGPKDGSGYLNDRIRSWLRALPQARLFIPAGNDGLTGGHAVLTCHDGRSAIGWMVPPADPLSTHAEVWFTRNDPETRLHLTPPGQDAPITINLAPETVIDLVAGADPQAEPFGRVYVLPGKGTFKKAGCLVCLGPTRPRRPERPAAPAGLWQIAVSGRGDLRADVTLQSERGLTPHSRMSPPTRLLALSDGGAQPQRSGTLNDIGILTGATLVNGMDLAAQAHLDRFGPGTCHRAGAAQDPAPLGEALARWTSRGDPRAAPPTSDGMPFPADRSRALPGIPAPGYRSGSSSTVEGTSFSTALASRDALVALVLSAPQPAT